MNRARIDEVQLNEACEQFMRDVLASQVRELDALGMGHIPYAVKARRCLGLYEEAAGTPARRAGDRPGLRLVQPAG
jgi:hypothetical protein